MLTSTGTIITCSPIRYDTKNKKTLKQNILRNLEAKYSCSLEDFLQHIVTRTIGYIEDPSRAGLFDPCFHMFSSRIAHEASAVSECYDDFLEYIEPKRWEKLEPTDVKRECQILVNARGIHNDIRNLKPVFDDQDAMMKRLLRWLTNRNKERKEKNDLAETWKPIAFDKTENLNLRVQRLDEDAYRVIESIQTILSMKQQQASLDIAASAEIQGIVLVIFTIITILFVLSLGVKQVNTTDDISGPYIIRGRAPNDSRQGYTYQFRWWEAFVFDGHGGVDNIIFTYSGLPSAHVFWPQVAPAYTHFRAGKRGSIPTKAAKRND